MKQKLHDRELVTLDGAAGAVHGTLHTPSWQSQDPQRTLEGSLAIVILNSLSTPRAGYSDSAVEWADILAAKGYPTFRLDLPGLGDTYGKLPLELLTFITEGGYASAVKHILKQLVEQYALSGIVVVGHCAGGVTGMYAAAEYKGCKGLIVVDPYFNFPKRVAPKLPSGLLLWSRNTKLGSLLRHGYDWARDIPRAVRKDGLPNSANRAFLQQWKQVASKGTPILVLRSHKANLTPGQFDYMQHAIELAGGKAQIEVRFVENTDHSFADTAGRWALRNCTEKWLGSYFPQTQGEDRDTTTDFAATADR